jgi:hypothetical protein
MHPKIDIARTRPDLTRRSVGTLQAGSFLVSNFNDKANDQGTGTTIEQITPSGKRTQFAQIASKLPGPCPGGVDRPTAAARVPHTDDDARAPR